MVECTPSVHSYISVHVVGNLELHLIQKFSNIYLNNIKSKMQGFTSGTPLDTEQHLQNNYGGGSGEATTGFVAKINN